MKSFNAFPKPSHGDNGLNNASILTFSKDVIDALIKELTQNSIDAKVVSEKKVRIKVDMMEIGKQSIEGISGLEEILDRMSDYWQKQNQSDFVKFFNAASKLLQEPNLYLFSFQDFNTFGLEGDHTGGTFKRLIFDEGASEKKSDNALGGFGIGKNSFFALTVLNTVFYSSLNSKEGHKFMGVTKLAEYIDSSGVRREGRIYYGDWTGDHVKLISDPKQIPSDFLRTENGLSSYAFGVVYNADWKNLVIKAFIRNYWFLFEKDYIEAEIGDVTLNKANYSNYATDVFDDEDPILAFIETFKNPQLNEEYEIHAIGNIRILLSEEPENSRVKYPDKIVFFRDGMMIKNYDLGRVRNLPNNVAGIIYCANVTGNKILSNMEPPAHDDFQSFYLPKRHPTLTENDGKKIIKQIEDAKTEMVRKIKSMYSQPTKQVAYIDELLSGFSVSTGDGNSVGKKGANDQESFYMGKKDGEKRITMGSGSPNIVLTDSDSETDPALPSPNPNPKPGSKLNPGPKSRPMVRPRKENSIDSAKIFYSHEDSGCSYYKLIVYSKNDLNNASIKITQHGDSPAKVLTTELIEVSGDAKKFDFRNNGNHFEIYDLQIKSGVRNVYTLKLKENFKSAFKILN